MRGTTPALTAVLAALGVLPWTARACPWPLFSDAEGRSIPDTLVRIEALPRAGGAALERGVFLGKVSSFGPCPPLLSAAAPSPVVTAEPADACNEIHPVAAGSAVVADRGTCNFLNKTVRASAAGAASLIVGNVAGAGGDAAGVEELPLMGCPDGMDDVCLNVSIPAVILYSQDKLQLEQWQRNAEKEDVILQATIYERTHPALDPSSLVIWLLATGTVIAGSQLAVVHDRAVAKGQRCLSGAEQDENDTLPIQDLSMVHALGFVFIASGMLVLLFFFIRYLILVLVLVYCFAAATAIANVFPPLLSGMVPTLKRHVKRPCCLGGMCDGVSQSQLLCTILGVVAAGVWFVLRHSPLPVWPLHDVLSLALCLQILQTVRFADVKVSSVLLSLALLYDIFWVFISPLLFSDNVMIATATGMGHDWGNSTDLPPAEMLPMLVVVPKVHDWAGGESLLGLGDIVLPGLLVAFALRVDVVKRLRWNHGYFVPMVVGYGVGLAVAIVASMLMQMGQPALLYLVPCTLWPFLILAARRGHLRELWGGLGGEHTATQQKLLAEGNVDCAGEEGGGGGHGEDARKGDATDGESEEDAANLVAGTLRGDARKLSDDDPGSCGDDKSARSESVHARLLTRP